MFGLKWLLSVKNIRHLKNLLKIRYLPFASVNDHKNFTWEAELISGTTTGQVTLKGHPVHPVAKGSWLEWILQNQVSARRLELNKIIFRQIAPTLYDLVVLKDQVYKDWKGEDENGYSKIWIKAYIEVSCFSRSFCKNLVQGANNVGLITVPLPRLPCKAYS